MNNKEKIKSLYKEYSLTIHEIKNLSTSETFNGFLGCICSKCKTSYNLPAGLSKKQWKCGVCTKINDFDFFHILIPFKSPHLGPTRNSIERGLSMKPKEINEEKKKNGIWKEYPCYFRL